jgi:hypothetical protein
MNVKSMYVSPPKEPSDNATIAEIDAYVANIAKLISANKLHPVPAQSLIRVHKLKTALVIKAANNKKQGIL